MSQPDNLQILVCVRQVPDAEGVFRPDPEDKGLDESGVVFRMNEYDLYAVEEAVQWKERYGNTEITVLSVGPERTTAVVRRALEFGADRGVHILTRNRESADALGAASLIASYASTRPFGLLLFGVMSEDLQRCQTGPMAAAFLDLPHASGVIAARRTEDGNSVYVEQEMEAGRREVLELPLPALLAVQPGINQPRYPSLSNKLRARNETLESIPCEKLGQAESLVERLDLHPPPPAQPGAFLSGTPDEKAEKLVQAIHEKTGLL